MPDTADVYRWTDVPAEPLNPQLTRRFVSGAQTTIARIDLQQGALVPTHMHPNEQISSVVSGSMRFVFDPDGDRHEFIVNAGEFIVIPPALPHSAEALEDTVNIDFFAPAREDWARGDDAYLRAGTR